MGKSELTLLPLHCKKSVDGCFDKFGEEDQPIAAQKANGTTTAELMVHYFVSSRQHVYTLSGLKNILSKVYDCLFMQMQCHS